MPVRKFGEMSVGMVQRSSSLNAPSPPAYKAASKSQLKKGDVNMNSLTEDIICLAVVLPDGKVREMDVDSSTQMMDLLVQVASKNKLRPGDHFISVISEETGRTIDYKPSQTISSLDMSKIYLISKKSQKHERDQVVKKQRDASKFETTMRVTINLPRGVKSLQRLNPNTPIMDIFKSVCKDKGLDASRYEVQLPSRRNETIDMSKSLAEYNSNELSIVACSVPEFHRSMIDISSAGTHSQLQINTARMGDPFEKVKKKKGLFSFLRRDKKSTLRKEQTQTPSSSPQISTINSDVTFQPRGKPQAQVRPQPQIQTTIQEEAEEEAKRNKAMRAPSKKKYKAPPPPRPLSQLVNIREEKKVPMYSSTPNLSGATSSKDKSLQSRRQPIDTLHSRNSSDSSGYHEAPLTPPQESDESQAVPNASILPVRAKHGQKIRPASAIVQRSQTLPGGAVSQGKRRQKKKAPAPPGPAKAKKAPTPPILHGHIVESEEDESDTDSLSRSLPDESLELGPELGLTAEAKGQPPPIFIPPPPPPETPPPVVSSDSPTYEQKDQLQSSSQVAPLHSRSESRCSRTSVTSVNTIDDVQMSFELAIAAGETQLQNEQGTDPEPEKLANLTKQMEALTQQLGRPVAAPSQDDINAAVAHLDLCVGGNSDSEDSIVPDGQNFTVATDDKNLKINDGTDSIRSRVSESGYAKPVEEITYGFENPFRLPTPENGHLELGRRSSRDSHVSDSTLPDSEHTDRPQSNSLQSSLQSDEEAVNDAGDSTDKTMSQSETDTVTPADLTDGPFSINQIVQKTDRRGLFLEAKGQEINKAIYGDEESVLMRGFKGQVKERKASYCMQEDLPDGKSSWDAKDFNRKPEVVRPKTVFDVLQAPAPVTSHAPKRRSAYAAVQLEAAKISKPSGEKPLMNEVNKNTRKIVPVESKERAQKIPEPAKKTVPSIASAPEPYTRPLPVYSRMNSNPDKMQSGETKPLAALISESMKNGEVVKPKRHVAPDAAPKPMFFKAASRPTSQENQKPEVIRLEVQKPVIAEKGENVTKSDALIESLPKENDVSAQKTKGSSLARKESLKEQYTKLQDQMARWQNQLKENETRMKSLTASQQNLANLQSDSVSTRPLNKRNTIAQSVPEDLNKVTLRSAADRVIHKPPPVLDPVETLLKSIRDRGGRTADDAPDRGIYVAEGDKDSVDKSIAEREIAPTVLAPPPPAPQPRMATKHNHTKTVEPPVTHQKLPHSGKSKQQTAERHRNDPRFKAAEDPRDNLLNDIVKQRGKPRSKRHSYAKASNRDSSSQSSSDELQEMQPRHRPTRNKQKRSVSDPFPPQPNGGQRVQPQMTELDPREELMIAIRNSGGLNTLRQVNEDEIRWSAQV